MSTVLPAGATVTADVTFEIEVEGRDPLRGTLRGDHSRLRLEVDDPAAFAGARDAGSLRGLADQLAELGIQIRVEHDGVHLVTLGATRAPWWQRPATGSSHIRLGSVRGVWAAVRGRAQRNAPVLPDATLLPASTMFPIAPTFQRRRRGPVTTTHDPAHGGGARLVMAMSHEARPGERQVIFWLKDGVTTIGSAPTCDIVLAGLADLHAEVHHDENDEYVLVSGQPDTRVHGARTRGSVLRTGSRVEVGTWQLANYREEFADHGRPYGGRIGGELGRQRPQPPRRTEVSPPRDPSRP